MKRLIVAFIVAMIIGIGLAFLAKAETTRQERATVEFTETVRLYDVLLKGEYLVVHDEELMVKGLPCTYIYDRSGKLVVSFHCTPVERPKTNSFRLVTTRHIVAYGPAEIREIQFPGSTTAHLVPSF